MFCLCTQGAIAATAIAVVYYLRNFKPLPPIFGIYRQNAKFYYLKFCAMYMLLTIRKRTEGKHEDIDKRQPLSDNPLAIDAVYFNGAAKDGCILAMATAQRRQRLVNGFCILRVPQFSDKVLVNAKFPDSNLIQTVAESEDTECYAVEGMKLKPVVPMQSWKLSYNGKMKFVEDQSKEFDVKFDAIWNTRLPHFNFDVNMRPSTLARAISMEPWTREYFKELEHLHQTHYEQYGDVRGTATINGAEYPIFTNSMRDHSFAELRDWKNFHRYAMHLFSLENGDRITLGIISIPKTFASVELGFITIAAENKNYPITSCDMKLYQHGEHSEPPEDYALSFWAGNRNYVVQIKTHTKLHFLIGHTNDSRIVEMYSDFNVNGVKGWGVVEWCYKNRSGLE